MPQLTTLITFNSLLQLFHCVLNRPHKETQYLEMLNAVGEKTCPASSSMQRLLLQGSVFWHAATKTSAYCALWSYVCANIHQTNPVFCNLNTICFAKNNLTFKQTQSDLQIQNSICEKMQRYGQIYVL